MMQAGCPMPVANRRAALFPAARPQGWRRGPGCCRWSTAPTSAILAASGGKHVRWGMIFRSGATPLLTDADQAAVAKLHLANMVDLRSDEERQLAPSKIYGVPSPNRRTDPQQRMQHFLKYFSRPLI